MVKRTVNSAMLDALQGPFYPVALVRVDWDGDTVRVHSGKGDLSWGGHTWTGVGYAAGQVTLPADAAGMAAMPGSMRLGGDPDQIDTYLAQAKDARGGAVDVWFGVVTKRAGTTLIGEPARAGTAYVGAVSDTQEFSGDDLVRFIEVMLESADVQRARSATVHSLNEHQELHPGDTGFRWLHAAEQRARDESQKW
jgi:hypothetical protein